MIFTEIKGLHVLTDRELAKPRSTVEVIELAIRGGATAIQLRDKTVDDRTMIALGKEILGLTAGRIPLIVNDRVDVALTIRAQGVHVGQKDMSANKVRKLIGPDMILGVSVSTVSQAKKAEKDGADYLGVGPVYTTSTKQDADSPIGLKGLLAIKNAVSIPVIAIGGINANNAIEVAKIADGIAVISAVMNAGNPLEATQHLSMIIASKRAKRII